MQDELAVPDLGIMNLCPVDHPEVLPGLEKGKYLDSERSENDVGMPAAAYAKPETPDTDQGIGDNEPPPSLQRRLIHAPVLSREDHEGDAGTGSE